MMERILITGSNGLVGRKLVAYHKARMSKEPLLATSLHPATKGLVSNNIFFKQMDITSRAQVGSVVHEFMPSIIIHTAALSQVEACEKDKKLAYQINVEGTQNMIQAANSIRARMIYLSTDFVFDGNRGPYRETSTPNPINYYGMTKWEGEKRVMEVSNSWAIVRTILVYGYGTSLHRLNFVLWVSDSLRQGKTIYVVKDQYRMPTLAEDLAQAVYTLAYHSENGIFHVSGPESISMFEFSQQVAREYHLDPSLIIPVTTAECKEKVRRPLVTGFVLTKARKVLKYRPHNIHEGLMILLAQKQREE